MLHQEIYNDTDKNVRLDIFLKNHIKNTSRSKIQKLIINGSVRVDEYIVKPSYILKGSEYITVNEIVIDTDSYIKKENIPINIIYEDKDIIVINKPSGLVVHPGAGNKEGTLLNGLLYHFENLSSINISRPGIVHRLDKNTSGIMLVAKTDNAHHLLSEQFINRTIKKTYRAIVWGNIQNEGKVEGYITRDNKSRIRFKLDNSRGKFSSTTYKKISNKPPFSYLELYPLTGRTHQIRVHLNSIGHSIILDDMYGGGENIIKSYHSKYTRTINKVINKINRFALHAYKIEFVHPVLNKKMKFKADLPNDMLDVLRIIS